MLIVLSKAAPSSEGSVRQPATAASHAAPCGAWRRPWRYSKVVSSGAISPARAPPSMLMLQMVMRCSMVSARIASPRYSKTCPVPPPTPIRADQVQDDVLGADARGEAAVDADLVGLRVALEQRLGREHHLDLAGADPERQGPERAVRAGVRVAADDRHAGLGEPELRPDDVDDALARRADAVERDPELGAVVLELADLGGGHLVEDRQVARGGRDRVVGGRDGLARPPDRRPRLRSPVKACGLVTSWTRCRSTARTAGAPGSCVTTWSSQIFVTMVRGSVIGAWFSRAWAGRLFRRADSVPAGPGGGPRAIGACCRTRWS